MADNDIVEFDYEHYENERCCLNEIEACSNCGQCCEDE